MKNILFFFFVFTYLNCTKIFSQTCPEIQLNNLEVLSGTNTNLAVGDRLIKRNTIVHNGVSYDAVFEVTSKNIGTGTLAVSGTSNLLIRNTVPNTNPYITYNLVFVPSGTATATGTLEAATLPKCFHHSK